MKIVVSAVHERIERLAIRSGPIHCRQKMITNLMKLHYTNANVLTHKFLVEGGIRPKFGFEQKESY